MSQLIFALVLFCSCSSASPVRVLKIRSLPSASAVHRVTEELPFELNSPASSHDPVSHPTSRPLAKEFADVLAQLVGIKTPELTSSMQNDQPQSDMVTNLNTSKLSHEQKQDMETAQNIFIMHLLNKVRETTGHQDAHIPNETQSLEPLPFIPPTSATVQKIEFVQPTCKDKPPIAIHNLTLYLHFEVDFSNANVAENTSQKVESAQLRLQKLPLTLESLNDLYPSANENDVIDSEEIAIAQQSLKEDLHRLNVSVSNRVLEAQAADSVAHEKLIRVNIYKIRKNKTSGVAANLLLLTSATIPALAGQDTTWNISRTLKGNSTTKKLDLIIEVEDQKFRKLPAVKFFKLECDPRSKGKPVLPSFLNITVENFTRAWNQSIWLELRTREVNVRSEIINTMASGYNHSLTQQKQARPHANKAQNYIKYQTEDANYPPE